MQPSYYIIKSINTVTQEEQYQAKDYQSGYPYWDKNIHLAEKFFKYPKVLTTGYMMPNTSNIEVYKVDLVLSVANKNDLEKQELEAQIKELQEKLKNL